MSLATNRLLLRLGRWPRRCAAAACLILAIGSLVGARTHRSPHPAPSLASQLRSDQVAVPVMIATVSTANVIHVGDRIGLLTSRGDDALGGKVDANLVADHLRVLSVLAAPDGSEGATVIVAADRKTATRIASAGGATVLAVLDSS